jgi:L-ascorbate metabolism protein UlaG (beta-lactamase superfamily)
MQQKFKRDITALWYAVEVKAFLLEEDVEAEMIRTLPWGGQVNLWECQSERWNVTTLPFRKSPKGNYLCGQPLGFILYAEPHVRIFHSGDTAIFSDLKLSGNCTNPRWV